MKNKLIFLIFLLLSTTPDLLESEFYKSWTSDNLDNTRVVIFGDYDNDGDLDFFEGNIGEANKIYRNDGNNIFTPIWISSEVEGTYSAAFGDYDNDGDLDILTGNYYYIRIYENQGGDTFVSSWTQGIMYPFGVKKYINGVAWGDFNNDGYLDFAVAVDGGGNKIYKNINGTTFSNIWTDSDTSSYNSIAWGDFNNDGLLDIVAGASGGGNLIIRANNGANNFTNYWVSSEVYNTVYSIAVADYNNDGNIDILIGTDKTNVIYKNNGNNTFTIIWKSSYSEPTAGIQFGDYDNDGDLDFIEGNINQAMRIYKNNNGNFTNIKTFSEINATYGIAFGDYNNDGMIDLLIGNQNQQNIIYKNILTEKIFTNIWKTNASYMASIKFGDYDNDGDLDILAGGGIISSIDKIYKNIGNDKFINIWSAPVADKTYCIEWGDYDNDGDLDFVRGGNSEAKKLYKNIGNDKFTNIWSSIDTFNTTRDIKFFDYDGDGDLDIIAGDNGTSKKVYRNNGDDTFTKVWDSPDWDSTYSIDVGDYDNDGDLDIIIANFDQPNKLYENIGNGKFTNIWASDESEKSISIMFGDYDNDGDLDIIVGNSYQKNRLYRNDGGGNFSSIWTSDDSANTYKIMFADINNDGLLDIVEGNYYSNVIYLNEGNDTFTKTWYIPNTKYTKSIDIGDYNNDGLLDLLLTTSSTNRIIKNLIYNMNKNNLPNNITYISRISNSSINNSTGEYTFTYIIKDNESDYGKIIKVEYSVDNKKWNLASVSGDLDNITTSPSGIKHTFIWNSSEANKDLITGNKVKIKVYVSSYFGNNNPIKSSGPLLYGSFIYQLTIPLKINGFPQCQIINPSSTSSPYDKVSGIVNLYGYAYDEDFSYYKLYYGKGTSPTTWYQIGNSYNNKVPPYNLLGHWDSRSLENGVYSLKIVTYDLAGKMRDSWSNINSQIRVEVVNPLPEASTIDYTYPATNQENIALNSPIIIHFSDKLNPNTITPDSIKVFDGENYIAGLIKYNDFSQSLIFIPENNLNGWKDYIVSVSADIQNIYGIPMGKEFSFKFKTTSYLPEKISSVYPSPGTPDVNLTSPLKIYYSDGTLSDSNFTNGINIISIVNSNSLNFHFAGFSNTTIMAKYTNNKVLNDKMLYIVTLTPTILDKGYYTWYFITEDITDPIVDFSHTSPLPDSTFVDINSRITIGFNKSMNDNTFSSETMYLSYNGTKVNCKITYSEADKEAYLTPLDPLQENTLYTVYISKNIKDFGGKNLIKDYQWNFKTGIIIDKNGGILSTSDNKISVMIPPHSISGNISIEIKKLSGTDIPLLTDSNLKIISSIVYKIGPSNLSFNKPVTIELNYNNTDIAGYNENKLSIYFYKNNKWQRIGGSLNKDENKILAIIHETGIIAVVEDNNNYNGKLEDIRIECQPRVFSPDKWGNTSISFSLPKKANYTVKIYNIAGKLIKVLSDDKEGNIGENVIYWDGKDSGGDIVPNRIYIISIFIDDGEKIIKKRKTVVVHK